MTKTYQGILPDVRNASCVDDATERRARLSELLVRSGQGDAAAFSKLHDLTRRKLMATIVAIVRRREVAEEVLQDVFLIVWQKAATFTPSQGAAMSWMSTIARNRALDNLKRVRHVSLDDAPECLELCGGTDPCVEFLHEEDLRSLHIRLRALPAEKERLVRLAYFQQRSRDEIAEQLGRPVGTVKTLLRRAIRDMQYTFD